MSMSDTVSEPPGTVESIFCIHPNGTVETLQLQSGQELWQFYPVALDCQWFTVAAHHVFGDTGYAMHLIVDEEAALGYASVNEMVSTALGTRYLGKALLVCLHAPDETGDDERLADIRDIYHALGGTMAEPLSGADIAEYLQQPLAQRVRELLSCFEAY